MFVDGDVFRIDVDEAQHEPVRRRDRAGQDALAAPMPATVTRILVEVGQQVARGDTLLLLEAMKMELPIKAPHDGRVTASIASQASSSSPASPSSISRALAVLIDARLSAFGVRRSADSRIACRRG